MRLKQIKLAGFKSFVDVTKVPFPQQMTAIVGPNGCGKSNIIDAVRWVLGESSAKNLRGDAMTDVIFNGSSARKPVGQASVELLFDNQIKEHQPQQEQPEYQFHLAENLAERAEISVRRTVNRDGINHYFLNGSKCRKKDITDLFLGSGLGPKSYAIIEQGMISRLIESKPQELRIFVEEAAGVSKYKERRRETENKLKATRENMQRLADISQEIDLHLDVLSKQAEEAKKFRVLKAQERELKTEIALIKQQNSQRLLTENKAKIFEIEQRLQDAEINSDSLHQKIAKCELEIDQNIATRQQHQEVFNNAKQQALLLTQQLAHTQQQLSKINDRQQSVGEKHQKLLLQLQTTKTSQDDYLLLLAKLSPEQQEIDQQLKQALDTLASEKDIAHTNENKLQSLQDKRLANKQQELANTRATLEINQKLARLNAFHEEKTHYLQKVTQSNQNDLSELYESRDIEQNRINKLSQKVEQQKAASVSTKQLLDNLLGERQLLEGQITKLNAQLEITESQLTNKSEWQQSLASWLNEHEVEVLGSYHQFVQVDNKWQKAVQKVLGTWLQAPVLKSLPVGLAKQLKGQDSYWLIDKTKLLKLADVKQGTLGSLIKCELGVLAILDKVYVADSVQEAYQKLLTIEQSESVITPEGILFNACGSTRGEVTPQIDYLALQSNKSVLLAEFENAESELTRLQENINQAERSLEEVQQAVTEYQAQIHQSEIIIGQAKQNIERVKFEAQKQKSQQQLLISELDNLSAEITELNEQQLSLQANFTLAEDTHILEQQINSAVISLEKSRNNVSEQQGVVDEVKRHQQNIHQHESQQKILLSQTQIQLASLEEQLNLLEEQKLHFSEELSLLKDPKKLQVKLSDKQQEEQKFAEQLVLVSAQLTEHKAEKARLIETLAKLTKSTEQEKAQYHQLALKSEQLTFELNAVNEQLEAFADASSLPLNLNDQKRNLSFCQKELTSVARTLNELGVVNLAAIDECQIQQQRKNQIDLQIEDLTQALATLESAITKIDKESRAKFKQTFEQINQDFTTLFPKVFGGGSAYLALTSDDMLETGVTIMARPPGKKNSTIHLLSGGEKALTALSLVFAIFKLTPAPFCMLDEVDAPLDDANVERFCNLVQEMSKTVQFIYISHNKIAMEMASYLTGVTMGEPGVSRMVSVDIDEAIAMAEVS